MVQRLGTFDDAGLVALTWRGGAVVEIGLYDLIPGAPYPLRITSLDHGAGTAGMSFTVAITNGANAVTGLSAVNVGATTTPITNTAATGNQAVPVGGQVTASITAAAGAPTGGRLVLRFTRA